MTQAEDPATLTCTLTQGSPWTPKTGIVDPNFRKYKWVLESIVRGGFVASLSPVETVLG